MNNAPPKPIQKNQLLVTFFINGEIAITPQSDKTVNISNPTTAPILIGIFYHINVL
ncbi:hypothetical protein FACS1894218_4880 [Bacilli bacterium]|nr:hypothetical protein FACS1894218_4880 [Bacilli bacterium]